MFPQGTGEATVQQDVCASSMAVVLWGWQRGHMRSGWGTWVKRPFSLPDVEVRFPLAKLFGGEGAAEDVPSVLLVSGGARPGRLGLELLELALLAGGGEGHKGDGRGAGQIEGLADRCHGGGQLASPGLLSRSPPSTPQVCVAYASPRATDCKPSKARQRTVNPQRQGKASRDIPGCHRWLLIPLDETSIPDNNDPQCSTSGLIASSQPSWRVSPLFNPSGWPALLATCAWGRTWRWLSSFLAPLFPKVRSRLHDPVSRMSLDAPL